MHMESQVFTCAMKGGAPLTDIVSSVTRENMLAWIVATGRPALLLVRRFFFLGQNIWTLYEVNTENEELTYREVRFWYNKMDREEVETLTGFTTEELEVNTKFAY